MSRTLFPAIQPAAVQAETPLPLCREIAWDFAKNIPIFQDGKPLEVTGLEAVKVWIWKALHTARYQYEAYTWDYGNELESLIGSDFSDELKQSEAIRYVKEALEICPYIERVEQVKVNFEDSTFTISCKVQTIYGEVEL
ncbi:MAG: DUF2634 domain-containing protein [Clostridiales bacterium]|nr:DUF2634 domain-containing protein [Clostridiales bacterium]